MEAIYIRQPTDWELKTRFESKQEVKRVLIVFLKGLARSAPNASLISMQQTNLKSAIFRRRLRKFSAWL